MWGYCVSISLPKFAREFEILLSPRDPVSQYVIDARESMTYDGGHDIHRVSSLRETGARAAERCVLCGVSTLLGAMPEAGDVIRDTGGLRKVRWSVPGRGKSGGMRIIY